MTNREFLTPARGYLCWSIAGSVFLLGWLSDTLQAQGRTSDLELTGKVIVAGGQSPPEPARIELSCKGNVQVLGSTDPQGLFNFRIPAQLPALDDPSRAAVTTRRSRLRYSSLEGCELFALLKGYLAMPIRLSRRSGFDGSSVGQIMLQPEAATTEGAGEVVSVQALSVPGKAQKAYSRALEQISVPNRDLKLVLRHLKEALTIHPQFTEAWILVGKTHALNGNVEAAREAFVLALRSDPTSMPALLSLCLADLKLNRIQEAAAIADQALERDPRLIEAHFYAGLAQVALGNLAAAEKSLLAVSTSPECSRFPRAYYLLGDIYFQQGNHERAAQEYKRYLEAEPTSQAAAIAKQRLAEFQPGVPP